MKPTQKMIEAGTFALSEWSDNPCTVCDEAAIHIWNAMYDAMMDEGYCAYGLPNKEQHLWTPAPNGEGWIDAA